MKTVVRVGLTLAFLLGIGAQRVSAAPALRYQADLQGDFVLIGNSLALDCGASVPLPIVGDIGDCGDNIEDNSPDVFWRSDSPLPGQVTTTPLPSEARSTAVLSLPAGADVNYARIYWSAETAGGEIDRIVTLSRENGFSETLSADDTWLDQFGIQSFYQGTADVTDLVATQGPGAYRVSGVGTEVLTGLERSVGFAGWSMMVVYSHPNERLRNVALFDGFDRVAEGEPALATLSGFSVPNGGFDAKLGVVAYEGDDDLPGDELRFGQRPLDATARLSNGLNPVDGFFNGTRSNLGLTVSVVGDLPQFTGTPSSTSGIDLDVVDITERLSAGQTSAQILASSTGDVYFLSALVTSISTLRPEFYASTKTARDVNGDELVVGDELAYAINIVNAESDGAADATLLDQLPDGVSYVPGSLRISAGANAGPLSDEVGDDAGAVVGNEVLVYLGADATSTAGGTLAPGESVLVEFRVVVNDVGVIENQAQVTARGQLGATQQTTVTDGDPDAPGQQSTTSLVHECERDNACPADLPICDLEAMPHVCVQCVLNEHCAAIAGTCDAVTRRCIGPPDAGADASADAGIEAGVEGGLDAGLALGADAAVDATVDARAGAVVGGGSDAAVEGRADAGPDAGATSRGNALRYRGGGCRCSNVPSPKRFGALWVMLALGVGTWARRRSA